MHGADRQISLNSIIETRTQDPLVVTEGNPYTFIRVHSDKIGTNIANPYQGLLTGKCLPARQEIYSRTAYFVILCTLGINLMNDQNDISIFSRYFERPFK